MHGQEWHRTASSPPAKPIPGGGPHKSLKKNNWMIFWDCGSWIKIGNQQLTRKFSTLGFSLPKKTLDHCPSSAAVKSADTGFDPNHMLKNALWKFRPAMVPFGTL